MNYRISAAAEQDLTAAALWYEAQCGGLGAEFVAETEALLLRVCENPLAYTSLQGIFRRALLHRFHYSVIYTLGANSVEVIAVLHMHRDPEVWQQRIRN